MIGADADVLVEVEGRELRPVDPGRLPELREELVLRRRRGEDHGGLAVALHERADLVGDGGRRRSADRGTILVHLDPHPSDGKQAARRVRLVLPLS